MDPKVFGGFVLCGFFCLFVCLFVCVIFNSVGAVARNERGNRNL